MFAQMVGNGVGRLEGSMIILGVILLILGVVLKISILYIIGAILAIVGVVLFVLGAAGRQVGSRKHYY